MRSSNTRQRRLGFSESRITWNGSNWDLTLTDGTVYVFGVNQNAPLQAVRDRDGNTVTLTYPPSPSKNIQRITSPNGRWIAFTYEIGNGRVSQSPGQYQSDGDVFLRHDWSALNSHRP